MPFELDETYQPPQPPPPVAPAAGGWIKLYRKALHDGWLREHKLFVFFTYCLLRANHKSGKVFMDGLQIELEPGQFITGRDQVFRDTGLTEQNYRTALKRLKSTGSITTKTTNRCTVVTIVNWSSYQTRIDESNEQNNEQPNGQLTGSQRAANDEQEIKNAKNGEMGPAPQLALDDEQAKFIRYWQRLIATLGDGIKYRLTKQDHKALPELMKTEPLLFNLCTDAANYLLSDRNYHRERRTLDGLLFCWNDEFRTHNHTELQRKNLFPPDGVKLADWLDTPIEQPPPKKADPIADLRKKTLEHLAAEQKREEAKLLAELAVKQ